MRSLFIVLPAAAFQCGAGAGLFAAGEEFLGSQLLQGALVYVFAFLSGRRLS